MLENLGQWETLNEFGKAHGGMSPFLGKVTIATIIN